MDNYSTSQPLATTRIVDLTHGIAGPYCTKLLADYGANVIKVERPLTGDYARGLGPFPNDISNPETSGIFLFLNTNKRSIALDINNDSDSEFLQGLIGEADILVENFKPGQMEQWGLGYEALNKINPNLIMTSISNFGQSGQYKDYQGSDLVLYAMGGNMTRTGLPDRYPLQLVDNHVQYHAGNVAAMATLVAWYSRNHKGIGGQHIDISILETQLGSVNGSFQSFVGYQYTGDRPLRLSQGGAIGLPGNGYFPCLDGYVGISAPYARWPNVVAMLGMPELLDDPRFNTPAKQSDPEVREEFIGTIWLPWVLERTKLQFVEECQAHEIISGLINDISEAMDHNPQADSRGYFVTKDHPAAGMLRYPGAPIHAPKGWWQLRRAAPLLNEHQEEIRTHKWNASSSAIGESEAPSGKLPLEGIRVLDITLALAGPYATMLLADLGAEIIRLEPLSFLPLGGRGQLARPNPEQEKNALVSLYPNRDPGQRPWNRGSGFNSMARNKHSISIELGTPEGKESFRKLVEVSDLFLQNSVPGAMERLGLGYDTLKEWNPRMSMLSIAGPGQTGPWKEYRGWGYIFEALYGYGSIIGYPDMDADGMPVTVPSDPATGVTAVMATMMALNQREHTGQGSFIDISLGEVYAPHMSEQYMDYQMNRRVAQRMGNRHRSIIQGAYPCAGQDEWIAISISTIDQWQSLCSLMQSDKFEHQESFVNMGQLREHHDKVDRIISEWTKIANNYHLFHRLQAAGIPAGPLIHPKLAFSDPHLKEREFFVSVNAPEVGTHLYPSTIYKMSKIPFSVRKPPVRLGEDNEYVYRDVLGLTEEEYTNLVSLGYIGMDYLPHVP
jgi:crotonobetainyl-CoA:carnitine CoA-transferase CaiB-like acyl-CoA transferase